MNSEEPRIIYEDESLAVLDKPAGMIVNRADTAKNVMTVQDWIESKFQISNFKFQIDDESDFIKRSGIVHRLDKETSGLLIVAKTPDAFLNLQKQFKEGRVEKQYIALVHGNVTPREGEINVPIARLPWNRMRFGVFPRGRESRTLYKVTNTLKLVTKKGAEELSLIEAYPKTGRTHQIRVHFLYIGHPIFADELYAGRKTKKEDRKLLPRHFLHAGKISFNHPTTEERVSFESSLPPDLVDFLKNLA